MDMVLKGMLAVMTVYLILGSTSLVDFFILAAAGYLAVQHLDIYAGAPLYT